MPDPILTAAITLGGGVLVLVIGQVTIRLLVDPYIRFRNLLGEIAFSLDMHSYLYMNPLSRGARNDATQEALYRETSRELRRLAMRLRAERNAMIGYKWLARVPGAPRWEMVDKASQALVALSNGLWADEAAAVVQRNEQASGSIRESLGLNV